MFMRLDVSLLYSWLLALVVNCCCLHSRFRVSVLEYLMLDVVPCGSVIGI